MIYGLLFIIILIYCYEYWKMISKYKYLFFQKENTINEIKNTDNEDTNKIIKNKIKDGFANSKQKCDNCEFTPYNFTNFSNQAIDVSTFNETEKSEPKNNNREKLDLLKLQDKVIKFFNNLIKNYNSLISESLQQNQEQSIENIILINENNDIPLIKPNTLKIIFKDKDVSTFLLVNPNKFMESLQKLNENIINKKGKQEINQFMTQIFEDLKKVKEKYQISNMSNKQIEKKYFFKKPIYSKYYPNDMYISNKLGNKHQYLNKPIIREELPCKWKCQISWFQCHYSIDK